MTETRGFPVSEFRARVVGAQARMAQADLVALLLTTEPDIRYFTGFLTRFWESPTRPWFLVVPASGDPVAVIPTIGAALMRRSWITDIRTWNSPERDPDGLALLADALRDCAPPDGRIGLPSGPETMLRLPLTDFATLKDLTLRLVLADDAGILRALRMVKSEAEVAKIAEACRIAGRAFARVPDIARSGTPLDAVFRHFQVLCLDEGADWVGYLAGAAGAGGYDDVISPATTTPLAPEDVLMLDTGVVHDGYFCDFDRNYAVGPVTPAVADAHALLVEACAAAFDIARPGLPISALYHAMQRILEGGGAGIEPGRFGHGLGAQLTEWPSILPEETTALAPGMVMSLEPSLRLGPRRILVHEENIVIGETGARWLTTPAPAAMPVLERC